MGTQGRLQDAAGVLVLLALLARAPGFALRLQPRVKGWVGKSSFSLLHRAWDTGAQGHWGRRLLERACTAAKFIWKLLLDVFIYRGVLLRVQHWGGTGKRSLEGALGVLDEALEHISLKASQIQLNISLFFFK